MSRPGIERVTSRFLRSGHSLSYATWARLFLSRGLSGVDLYTILTQFTDTFTVQGDVIQSDVRLSPERVRSRIRRESSSDLDTDSDKDIEVLQVCHTILCLLFF